MHHSPAVIGACSLLWWLILGFVLLQVLITYGMGNVFSYSPPIAEVNEKTCDQEVRKRARCGVCLKPNPRYASLMKSTPPRDAIDHEAPEPPATPSPSKRIVLDTGTPEHTERDTAPAIPLEEPRAQKQRIRKRSAPQHERVLSSRECPQQAPGRSASTLHRQAMINSFAREERERAGTLFRKTRKFKQRMIGYRHAAQRSLLCFVRHQLAFNTLALKLMDVGTVPEKAKLALTASAHIASPQRRRKFTAGAARLGRQLAVCSHEELAEFEYEHTSQLQMLRSTCRALRYGVDTNIFQRPTRHDVAVSA